MRKGSIVDINKVAISVDKAIGKAEQMSGLNVHEAVVSINGSHITGTSSTGLITISGSGVITPAEMTEWLTRRLRLRCRPTVKLSA